MQRAGASVAVSNQLADLGTQRSARHFVDLIAMSGGEHPGVACDQPGCESGDTAEGPHHHIEIDFCREKPRAPDVSASGYPGRQ